MEKKASRFLRFDWPFHYVTLPLSLIVLVFSGIHLIRGLSEDTMDWTKGLLFGLSLCLLFAVARIRRYATKTQDRIIRSEEQFRHYRLTGRTLHAELTLPQIIMLRYAGDDEFPALCERAVKEKLDSNAIKTAIRQWRSDTMRI